MTSDVTERPAAGQRDKTAGSEFARRRIRRTFRRWRRQLIALLVIALVVATSYVVFVSPLLAISRVRVTGESTVPVQEILDQAAVPVGKPLARTDLGAIQARVEQIPAIASASVHRSWPHTLTIDVTQRTPDATIRRHRAWWDVDASGVLFGRSARRDHTLMVVAVPAAAGGDALREAMSVVESLPSSLALQTKRLTAKTMDSITLRLKNHSQVLWGDSSQAALKVEVLSVLLASVKAATYDVSVPAQPTTQN